jgi:hypothetical protein
MATCAPLVRVPASYSRTPGEAVAGSPNAISTTLSPAGALANYRIRYSNGNFTITKADRQAQEGYTRPIRFLTKRTNSHIFLGLEKEAASPKKV